MSDIYDDHRRSDDDLDDAERALAAQLTTALAVQAGTVMVGDEAFDPARPAMLGLTDGDNGQPPTAPPRRGGAIYPRDAAEMEVEPAALVPLPITPDGRAGRGRIVWVAGAAAAAVLVAAIVMINAVRQPSVEVSDDPAPLLVGPDTAWVPTWVPDGLELWSLSTTFGDPAAIVSGRSGGAPLPLVQLFESSTTDARLFVSIGDPRPSAVSRGAPVLVRGVEGTSEPEQSMGMGMGMGMGSRSGVRLEWTEGGRGFGALVVGADAPIATALLDGLSFVAADDPSSGFAAPADRSWTVRTDDPMSRPASDDVGGVFGYDRSRPTGERLPLQVVTLANGSSASGFPGYLLTAFLGSMRDDGVAEAFMPASGERPAESYTVWPDGRTVYSSGLELDQASAVRIAAGIEPVTRQELAARADGVSAKLGTGDVLAAADLPSGRVEVIGAPSSSAICLTAGSRRVCRSAEFLSDGFTTAQLCMLFLGKVCRAAESLPGGGRTLMNTFVIDGTWYVFGASDEGAVELGVGRSSGRFTHSGTATAVPLEPGDIEREDPAVVVPTTQGESEAVVETIDETSPADAGPTTTAIATGSGSGDMTSSGGPRDRSVPFESAVVGPWTLALLVVPADVDGAWATFPGQSMSFPRPLP